MDSASEFTPPFTVSSPLASSGHFSQTIAGIAPAPRGLLRYLYPHRYENYCVVYSIDNITPLWFNPNLALSWGLLNNRHMKNDYQISSGDIEPQWPLRVMYESGYLRPCAIEGSLYSPRDVAEEEAGISQFDPGVESPTFDRTRQHFREAIRAAVGHFFEKFDLPRRGGLDIGSGATGSMVHSFLDGTVEKHSWTEMDVNPQSVRANAKLHPGARVVTGSYHRLDSLNLHDSLDMVTGLSTLDATQFIPHAIAQIRNALRRGGYLFHLQDVRPGNGAGLRELQAMGEQSPFHCLAFHTDRPQPEFAAFASSDGSVFSTGELFRRQLDRAFVADGGYEVLLNDWVRSGKKIPGKIGRTYYLNSDLQHISAQPAQHEAYMIVTLARKN